jgi:tetratricopeptide (TPR) repeat protein
LGEFTEALEEIDTNSVNDERSVKELRAYILLSTGEYQRAISEYDLLINKDEKRNPYLLFFRGTVHYLLRSYERALSDYGRLNEMHQHDVLRLNIAACLLAMNRKEEAYIEFLKVAECGGEIGSEANCGLAIIYSSKGNLDVGIGYSDKAVELDRNNPNAFRERGILRTRLNLAGAEDDLIEAIKLGDSPSSEHLRAFGTFGHKKVVEDMNRILSYYPKNSFALLIKGFAKSEANDLYGAQSCLTDSIKLEDNELARLTRAEVFIELGRFDDAREDVLRALQIHPEIPEAYYVHGKIKFFQKSGDLGFSEFSKSIDLGTHEGEPYYYRGLINLSNNKIEEGMIDLSRAGELGYEDAFKKIEEYQTNPEEFRIEGKENRRKKKSDDLSDIKKVKSILESDLKGKIKLNETVSGTNKAKIKSIFKKKYKKQLSDNMLRSYLSKLGYSKERGDYDKRLD